MSQEVEDLKQAVKGMSANVDKISDYLKKVLEQAEKVDSFLVLRKTALDARESQLKIDHDNAEKHELEVGQKLSARETDVTNHERNVEARRTEAFKQRDEARKSEKALDDKYQTSKAEIKALNKQIAKFKSQLGQQMIDEAAVHTDRDERIGVAVNPI